MNVIPGSVHSKKISHHYHDEGYGEGCKATTINIISLLKYDV